MQSKGPLSNIEDSVHVMIKKDKLKQQTQEEKEAGYVPRTEHPLVKQKSHPVAQEDSCKHGNVVYTR